MNATMTAVIAVTSTAAADKSFTFLMSSCFWGDTKSDRFSIAELMISNAKTEPIQSTIATHSIQEI